MTPKHVSYTPFVTMRGGASLCKPFEIPGGFWVAPVVGVSGMATTGRMWAESEKIPLSVGGLEPAMYNGMYNLIASTAFACLS